MKSSTSKFAIHKLKSLVLAATVLSTIGLTSCLDDNDPPTIPDGGYVSIYNGAPHSTGLIVSTDVNTINHIPLNYSETIGYKSFYPGERPFYFSEQYSASRLFEKKFTVKVDSVYSMFIINNDTDFDAIMLDDNWEEPNAEEAQLRFVHLSSNVDDVNILIDEEETPLSSNTAFKGTTGFKKIPQGMHTFRIVSATTGETLATAKDINLRGNRVYTLILKGFQLSPDNNKKLDLQILTNYVK